jgi:hypothetical protein
MFPPDAVTGVLVPRENGGYVWCRPDRLPDAELTLEAELAFRKRLLEDDREQLRLSWNLGAPAQPEINDVLFQTARSHVGKGRAPRSTRRVVVRGNSSRGDPDPSEPEPPLDLLDAAVLALGWGRV